MARIPMDQKEVMEGRRVGISESILSKLAQGFAPNMLENEKIKRCGKVYVEAHKRDGKWMKSQFRNIPGGRRLHIREASNEEGAFEVVSTENIVGNEGETFDEMVGDIIKPEHYGEFTDESGKLNNRARMNVHQNLIHNYKLEDDEAERVIEEVDRRLVKKRGRHRQNVGSAIRDIKDSYIIDTAEELIVGKLNEKLTREYARDLIYSGEDMWGKPGEEDKRAKQIIQQYAHDVLSKTDEGRAVIRKMKRDMKFEGRKYPISSR